MKKETTYKVIAVILPFIFALFIEVLLRLVAYGDDYQLFHSIKIDNKTDYLVMNSKIAGKYFNNESFHSDNQSDIFLKTKSDSTLRIFVQGASSVVGFPYYGAGSFPRMLKHRLAQTFPEKNIEVINTGMTAINSYTLLDQTNKIIQQKPDAVIIYAGHNEYYGALGLASSSTYGSHPTIIKSYLYLMKLRIFQWLNNTYTHIQKRKNNGPKIGETTLMEIMVKKQKIPFGSPLYHAGLKQFKDNLQTILQKYQKENIPIIISTLVSNIKDIKPFISDHAIDSTQFIKEIQQNTLNAIDLAHKNAIAAYTLGQYYLQHQKDTSQKYLQLAKELDLLRFRAPQKINDIIFKLAQKYHCHMVDMEAIFSHHSPMGIIGDELLTEHVHPNIEGHFIMADAFYNKIKEIGLIHHWENYISYDEAFNDIPVTEIDSIKGKLVIDDLKKSWPYDLSMSGTQPLSVYYSHRNPPYELRKAIDLYTNKQSWREIMLEAYDRYKRNEEYKKALRVAQSFTLEYPEQSDPYKLASDMCLKLNDSIKAKYYSNKYNQLKR
ncbi:SGNH/GDSL hydrolase family protein [Saccharicrinis fermentans]|uniref:Uncharacterized protein n=1 Tax=Saccharicrinis fermentans DSM 9555 = JCM 21142 TaxID=869213 RepID=W7YHT7_9BACT|nr:GDSL-type esterase/lipase family protein [Saccharicrinis fermentans]GAF04041.1 hypothetical protein JCM21142_72734 [Saccharicrinis fermentans DSM 9555 = JCM 21142]